MTVTPSAVTVTGPITVPGRRSGTLTGPVTVTQHEGRVTGGPPKE